MKKLVDMINKKTSKKVYLKTKGDICELWLNMTNKKDSLKMKKNSIKVNNQINFHHPVLDRMNQRGHLIDRKVNKWDTIFRTRKRKYRSIVSKQSDEL